MIANKVIRLASGFYFPDVLEVAPELLDKNLVKQGRIWIKDS